MVGDAWDAMTYDRHYRAGLGPERAREILRRGAGSQWRSDAVDLVLAELDEGGGVGAGVFDDVGPRREGVAQEVEGPGCRLCDDAVPAHLVDDDASVSAYRLEARKPSASAASGVG